jgi:hypothetical protein
MGEKTSARRVAVLAGVPVVPGALHPLADNEAILVEAERIGFPLMLKAAAGGGGKGLRLVHKAEDLEPAVLRARSEAKSAFGDDSLYIERAILKPRHIEIQVLADTSRQRRPPLRARMFGPAPSSEDHRGKPLALSHPRAAGEDGRARGGSGEKRGLRERGHTRVPGRREPRALLPRDEHPSSSRTPHHRNGDRHRSGPDADQGGTGRGSASHSEGHHPDRPRHRMPGVRRGSRGELHPQSGARSNPCACPEARACATTRVSTRASRSRCSTTR